MSDDFDWTDDAIAKLVRLWGEGKSCSAIGTALGCSRNAVIGKVHRLAAHTGPDGRPAYDLKLRGQRLPRPVRAARAAAGVAVKAKARQPGLDRTLSRAGQAQTRPKATPLRFGAPAQLTSAAPDVASLGGDAWTPRPGQVPVPLEALGPHDCKWPLGDPLGISAPRAAEDASRLEGASFGFCGAPQRDGSSYCAGHHARAYSGIPQPKAPAKSPSVSGTPAPKRQAAPHPSRSDRMFAGGAV